MCTRTYVENLPREKLNWRYQGLCLRSFACFLTCSVARLEHMLAVIGVSMRCLWPATWNRMDLFRCLLTFLLPWDRNDRRHWIVVNFENVREVPRKGTNKPASGSQARNTWQHPPSKQQQMPLNSNPLPCWATCPIQFKCLLLWSSPTFWCCIAMDRQLLLTCTKNGIRSTADCDPLRNCIRCIGLKPVVSVWHPAAAPILPHS